MRDGGDVVNGWRLSNLMRVEGYGVFLLAIARFCVMTEEGMHGDGNVNIFFFFWPRMGGSE